MRKYWYIGVPALAVAFFAARSILAPSPSPVPPGAAAFVSQTASLTPGKDNVPAVDLGALGLGSIRDLDLTLGLGGGDFRQVESSCSCLQILESPVKGADGSARLRARYMAVRPGPVDVTLAFSRSVEGGGEEILMARFTGSVGPGDAALADRLAEMVKSPLPRGVARDESGVVSAADARSAVEAGSGLLVDIRTPEEFAGSHVIGALNIPGTRLKPSGAFRGRDLYLTGPSLVTTALLEARAGLLRQGAGAGKVFVMRDGVEGWKAAGGKVFQEMDPPPVISAVSAADLKDGLSAAGVRVMGIQPADEFAFRYYFPGGSPVKEEEFTASVDARLSADPAARVVIVDGLGDRFGEVNKSAPAHWVGRVSYLRGNFEAYRAGVDQEGVLASRVEAESSGSTRGLAKRAPGQRVGVPMSPSSPGCGTCPKR